MDSPTSLQDLLEKIQRGDEKAQQEIYEEYIPFLRIVARRHISPKLQAKFDSVDVVQSVWADLILGLRQGRWSFSSPNHLRAFLARATKNRIVDYTRKHNAIAEQVELEDLSVPSQSARPSAEARANETWSRLVGDCSPQHREILEMKRTGHTLAEIASKTGYHPSSIRRILYAFSERFEHE